MATSVYVRSEAYRKISSEKRKGVCFNTGRTHFKKGVPASNKQIIRKICKFCNKIFVVAGVKKTQVACSAKCYYKSLLGKIPWNKGKGKGIKKRAKVYDKNWHEIRKEVYKKYSWTCQECGVHCTNEGQYNKTTIQCHHIDYDETNNNLYNLITLCASCHMKTNFSRQEWMLYFLKSKKE